MRLFSWLSGGMGAAFLAFAVLQLGQPEPALWSLVFAVVAAMSVLAVFERLAHRPAFAVTVLLGVLMWWTGDPDRSFDLSDGVSRRQVGLGVATGWMLLLAFVAQRVSARRLIEGA